MIWMDYTAQLLYIRWEAKCARDTKWVAEGTIAVHQEDNASPHMDKTFKDRLHDPFDQRGWKLEHQAPQGPQGTYTNVLDLKCSR
jgi:hypothetical protein